jgi:PAS domain S-box-containing protein
MDQAAQFSFPGPTLLADFLPHGYCMRWEPGLVGTHVVADALIVLAYFCIPGLLFLFIKRRRDVQFNWIFAAFGVFILACGMTHVMDIVTLWVPLYRLAAFFKVLTATVSVGTVIALYRLMPQIVQISTPAQMQLVKAAEAALAQALVTVREGKEQLQTLLDSATTVSVIATDLDGVITVFNTGAENMLQYRAEEVVGKQTLTVFHLESEMIARGVQLTEELGRPINGFAVLTEQPNAAQHEECEWTYVRKDGSHLSVTLVTTALREPGGRVIGFLGVALDISARKQAEAAAHVSEKLLLDQALVLNLANDSIMIRNNQDRVTYWNQGAQRLYGWSKEEAFGQVTHALFQTQFPQPLAEIQTQLLAQGYWNGELGHIRRDGSRITVASNWTLQRDDAHGLASILEITIDITLRKQAEREAAERNAQLKAVNKELAEARDRAEFAARSKGQFLAAMSHEIRTPMNGIIGMTALTLDTPLNSEQRCYVETIRSSGEALLGIINDVLDFSKMEAGKLELEKTDFDLQTVVEETTELVASAATAKNIELSFTIDPSAPLDLVGDQGRLRQILLNLLSNAVKFTPHGSVSLSVTQEALQDNTHVLRFAVKDTGIGITPAQQKGLFKAFAQADRSTTRRFGGTGLGLSIVKRLVEMMGGKIGIKSQIGVGSTFWFNICLTTANKQEERENLQDKHLVHAGRLSDSRRQYLQCSGLAVTEHAGGFGALAQLNSAGQGAGTPIDILLVDSADIQHPKELEKCNMRKICGEAPILVMGSPRDWVLSDEPRLEQLNSVFFVQKPIRRPALLLAIEAALLGRHASARLSSPLPDKSAGNAVRILVAEDNKVNQRVTSALLEKLGCQVDIVENGRDACRALERDEYDLVFMDCHMPVMDGFEATRRIRKMQTGGLRTPIVALSAAILWEERQRCFDVGMDDFLGKPISRLELERTLCNWIPALGPCA